MERYSSIKQNWELLKEEFIWIYDLPLYSLVIFVQKSYSYQSSRLRSKKEVKSNL